jgi:hypothetical protein
VLQTYEEATPSQEILYASLTSLTSWNCTTHNAGWNLSRFTRLRELTIDTNYCTDDMLVQAATWLKALTGLRKLEVIGRSLRFQGAINHLQGLKWLIMKRSNMALPDQTWPALRNLERLEIAKLPQTWQPTLTEFPSLKILYTPNVSHLLDAILMQNNPVFFSTRLLESWTRYELCATASNTFDENNAYPMTFLQAACISGTLDIVKELLPLNGPKVYPIDIEARHPKNGSTPLLLASKRYKALDIIKHLVAAGANVNAINNFGSTCLSLFVNITKCKFLFTLSK